MPDTAPASDLTPAAWQDEIFDTLKRADVRQVPYVPDAGHSRLIARVEADPAMRAIVLTTEEEGIAVACGAWLGGERAVVLMQSSGVGNCVNMLSLVENCRFPLVVLVTMRGEWGEFNQWQVPMSRATRSAFESMGVRVYRADQPHEVRETVEQALDSAFQSDQAVAVLLGQRLIGRKVWTK